jgi:hypothetical protein
MAKVTVELEVSRIIEGYGFKGIEHSSYKGEERKTYYTVWTDDKVSEGDKVSVEGLLGVKIEEFTGRDNQPKKVAAIHLNNAKVSGGSEAPF